jgi:hypothetical protein
VVLIKLKTYNLQGTPVEQQPITPAQNNVSQAWIFCRERSIGRTERHVLGFLIFETRKLQFSHRVTRRPDPSIPIPISHHLLASARFRDQPCVFFIVISMANSASLKTWMAMI